MSNWGELFRLNDNQILMTAITRFLQQITHKILLFTVLLLNKHSTLYRRVQQKHFKLKNKRLNKYTWKVVLKDTIWTKVSQRFSSINMLKNKYYYENIYFRVIKKRSNKEILQLTSPKSMK